MRASHNLIALCARVCVHPQGRAARQLQEASKCPKLPAYFLPPILPVHYCHARQQEKGFGGVGGGLFSLFSSSAPHKLGTLEGEMNKQEALHPSLCLSHCSFHSAKLMFCCPG